MFTGCPECGTVFRVTTAELRQAEGYVRCGHCAATFNAVASLTDEPPATDPGLDLAGDTARQPALVARHPAPGPSASPVAAAEPDLPPAGTEPEPEADPGSGPEPDPASLEFNVPEDNWSEFFVTEAPAGPAAPALQPGPDDDQPPDPLEGAFRDATEDDLDAADGGAGIYPALELRPPPDEAAGPGAPPGGGEEWSELLREVADDDDDARPVFHIGEEPAPAAGTSPAVMPEAGSRQPASGLGEPWVAQAPADVWAPLDPSARGEADDLIRAVRPSGWDAPAEAPGNRRGWLYGLGSAVLALALLAQLVHLQRDTLATEPGLLAPLRRVYGALGLPLMPAWDLRSYEVRNLEAVAGRTDRDTLEIQGRVAIVGNEPVGLPVLRVRLHDRFGKTLGSRVVAPADYLGGAGLPEEPVQPGVLLPIRISLKDPGPDAYGYDLDVCLPDRASGLACQLERDPFAR